MDYTAAHEDAPSVRVVRPLRLENHGELWYLQAYCTRSRAERLLRLERISALALLDAHARIGPPLKPGPRRAKAVSAAPGTVRTRRVVAVPREGFFPAPPAPPPNSPLVRVWLAE